jgi:hypothetical protein
MRLSYIRAARRSRRMDADEIYIKDTCPVWAEGRTDRRPDEPRHMADQPLGLCRKASVTRAAADTSTKANRYRRSLRRSSERRLRRSNDVGSGETCCRIAPGRRNADSEKNIGPASRLTRGFEEIFSSEESSSRANWRCHVITRWCRRRLS